VGNRVKKSTAGLRAGGGVLGGDEKFWKRALTEKPGLPCIGLRPIPSLLFCFFFCSWDLAEL
jgi:hypothetical protein